MCSLVLEKHALNAIFFIHNLSFALWNHNTKQGMRLDGLLKQYWEKAVRTQLRQSVDQ